MNKQNFITTSNTQTTLDIINIKLPFPLCIIKDRYGGVYSGGSFLAFNLMPFAISELNVDAGDSDCEYFWENDAKDYVIGKGNTPEEALFDLIKLLNQ